MRSSPAQLILFTLLFTAACGGSSAEFGEPRRLPRDRRPTVWDAPARERLGVSDFRAPSGGQARFVGATPEGWEERPPRQFRDLIWAIAGAPEAECWLTGGVGGGVAGNMVRWYGQFGLPPGSADGLPEMPFFGQTGRLLELSGSYSGRPGFAMLLVFVSDGNTVTSLKFVGPEAVVKENRAKFVALAASIRKDSNEGGQPAGQGAPPPDPNDPHTVDPHTADPHAAVPGGAATEPFTATIPPQWTRKLDSSRPLHHTAGGTEVYVSQLSGPLRAMLEIWRSEVGRREPLSDEDFAAVPKCEMLGPDALWLDVTGDYTSMTGQRIPEARVVVAVRADGDAITFAKLIGSAAEVEEQVEAFRDFCASLRRNS